MSTLATRRDCIGDALREHTSRLGPAGTGRWHLAIPPLVSGTALADDHWLTIDLCLPERFEHLDIPGHWSLLQHNSTTGPGVQFVLADGATRPALRGVWPLSASDDDLHLRTRIGQLCQSLIDAADCLDTPRAPEQPAIVPESASSTALADLCHEAGWPATIRANGSVAVKLEVDRFLCHALSEIRPDGRLLLWTQWACLESPVPAVEAALGLFLLAVSAGLRWAWAAAVGLPDRRIVRVQSVLPSDAIPSELGHALSALSMACRLCGPEVELLQNDQELAEAFAVSRGSIPAACAKV